MFSRHEDILEYKKRSRIFQKGVTCYDEKEILDTNHTVKRRMYTQLLF
jgi:hypothetical protein